MKDQIILSMLEVMSEYYGDWESYPNDHPTNGKYEARLFLRLMMEALERAGIH